MLAERPVPAAVAPADAQPGAGKRVLLVDCEDSFVHTLAGYIEATGADVTVLRHQFAMARLDDGWQLVVLSPGPGRPADFGVPALVRAAIDRGLPLFGVCLGLQAIVEALGGTLAVMAEPRHGKSGTVTRPDGESLLFQGLPNQFPVGRYHSLHAAPADLPAALRVTATTEDGVIMAVEHRTLKLAAVQFHPESIMTLAGGVGPRIIANVMSSFAKETLDAPTPRPVPDRRAVG
jgi:anthranilate synthase